MAFHEIKEQIRALQKSISGLRVNDSGWVDITINPGFGPIAGGDERPQVRRIGNVVHVKGGFNSAGIQLSSDNLVGLVPVGFRPTRTCGATAGRAQADPAATAEWLVSASGGITLRTFTRIASYYRLGGSVAAWLTD